MKTENRVRPPLDPFRKADLSAPPRRDTSVLSKRWAGDGSGTCRLPRRDTSVLAKRRIDKQPEKPCENPVIKVDKDRLRYYISVPFNKSCWGLQQDGLKTREETQARPPEQPRLDRNRRAKYRFGEQKE